MRSVPPGLTLVLPGLFGPRAGGPAPRLPALEWLLSRADVEGLRTADGFESTLFCLFEVKAGPNGPPVAAVARLGEGEEPDDHHWLLADPVRLAPHQDRVYLAGALRGVVAPAEAAAVAGQFNAHFATDGLLLSIGDSRRWYLRVASPAAITTTPTQRLPGHDIHPYLPQGPDAARWRAILNEVQMLLHASPVNEAREQRGDPPINALWIWGGGRLPDGATSRFRAVYACEPVARGLARLATVPDHPLPAGLEPLLQLDQAPGRLLVVDDTLREGDGGEAELQRLERNWFAPAREALLQGALAGLEIIGADGRLFRIGRRARLRFWCRRRPLAAYAGAAQ